MGYLFCQFNPQDVEDEVDQVRAQAKGQEIDEAKVRDSIEARLEKNLVRYSVEARQGRRGGDTVKINIDTISKSVVFLW